LQSQGDIGMVDKELMKIWSSVLAHKDTEMIAAIYQAFLNDQYKAPAIRFFVRTSNLILQNILGDKYHENQHPR
jgi:hypothetical protein